MRIASFGICSQTWMPGTLVAMGLNSPRYSTGESGFISQVSCCAGPPHMKRTMQALALPFRVVALSRALSNWGNPNPKRGRDPARKNSRLPVFICFLCPYSRFTIIVLKKTDQKLFIYKLSFYKTNIWVFRNYHGFR